MIRANLNIYPLILKRWPNIYQLDVAAKQAGIGIDRVIFEPQFHAKLFATKRGGYLKDNMHFMAHQAWVRHDEHYHVDLKWLAKLEFTTERDHRIRIL